MPVDYFPSTDNEAADWFDWFSTKLPGHAADLGLNAATVTGTQADAAMFIYLVKQFLPTATIAAGQFAAFKKLMADSGAGNGAVPGFPVLPAPPAAVMPGIVKRLRALVKRIKSAEGYTVAIGRDLRIIAPVTTTPTVAPKPKFKAVAQPNSMVRLAWTKGKFSGVVVESRRHGGNWEEIGRDNFSPYDDTRPPLTAGQPEVREYRLRYLQKDQPVGDYSDTITVTTTP